jgi:hypothetical protein
MEVKPTSNVDRAAKARAAKTHQSGEGTFSIDVPEENPAPMAAGPAPLAALDSLLVLQEMDDAGQRRSRGLKRGGDLLDMLDLIRDGLLAGGIPRVTLNRLADVVSHRSDGFADPALQDILDEIELRARVELAKLEMSEKKVA